MTCEVARLAWLVVAVGPLLGACSGDTVTSEPWRFAEEDAAQGVPDGSLGTDGADTRPGSVAQCCVDKLDESTCGEASPPESPHRDCRGNSGCRKLEPPETCRCYCLACYDERCVATGCGYC